MIDAAELLADSREFADRLVDDVRVRTESDEASRVAVRKTYAQASSAGRTNKTWEEWREDLLAQVAAGCVLACVLVRFYERKGLHDTPLPSGPPGAPPTSRRAVVTRGANSEPEQGSQRADATIQTIRSWLAERTASRSAVSL